jgi:predicted ATPase
VGRSNDPFGGDFLEQVAKAPQRTRDARLRRISDALKVAVPQLEEIELRRDERGTPHLRGKYQHWRQQGAWQNEEQFSDGTLRLMGLLWVVMETHGPLLLEEPELSLHPEIVRLLPQVLARAQRRTGRQVFLSTHSPELLRDSGIGLDEVLLLIPEREGTTVTLAQAHRDIRDLLEGGLSLADAVIPKTRPPEATQLALFADA